MSGQIKRSEIEQVIIHEQAMGLNRIVTFSEVRHLVGSGDYEVIEEGSKGFKINCRTPAGYKVRATIITEQNPEPEVTINRGGKL